MVNFSFNLFFFPFKKVLNIDCFSLRYSLELLTKFVGIFVSFEYFVLLNGVLRILGIIYNWKIIIIHTHAFPVYSLWYIIHI